MHGSPTMAISWPTFFVMALTLTHCILQTKIDKLGDLEPVSLYCDEPGSFKTVAEDMDDLAGLMDDIGLENLCRQLDLEPKDCTPF